MVRETYIYRFFLLSLEWLIVFFVYTRVAADFIYTHSPFRDDVPLFPTPTVGLSHRLGWRKCPPTFYANFCTMIEATFHHFHRNISHIEATQIPPFFHIRSHIADGLSAAPFWLCKLVDIVRWKGSSCETLTFHEILRLCTGDALLQQSDCMCVSRPRACKVARNCSATFVNLSVVAANAYRALLRCLQSEDLLLVVAFLCRWSFLQLNLLVIYVDVAGFGTHSRAQKLHLLRLESTLSSTLLRYLVSSDLRSELCEFTTAHEIPEMKSS